MPAVISPKDGRLKKNRMKKAAKIGRSKTTTTRASASRAHRKTAGTKRPMRTAATKMRRKRAAK